MTIARTLPRAVWLAVAAGLAVRLAFGLGYWVGKPLTHDEREYLMLARSLAEGRGFTYAAPDGSMPPGEHFGRAPVYPLMLAAIFAVTPHSTTPEPGTPVTPRALTAIKAVQAGLGAVVVLLIAVIAARAGGRRVAAAAAWLGAAYPALAWTPAYVFSETLFSVLALGSVLVMAARAEPESLAPVRAAAAGALAGLAMLTRPAMVFFVMLAAPWLWWRRQRLAAALLVLGAVLVVAPWSIRNTIAHGRFVAVASEGGITFWTGNHPLAVGDGDLAANPELKRANVAFRARHPGLSAEALEPLYYREALAWIRSEPLAWLSLMARKAFYTVVPAGPSYGLHSPLYYWGSVLPYAAILPFAAIGAVRLRRQGRLPAVLLVLAAASIVTGLVFFPQERFRIPVIDPTLVVLAAGCWLGGPDRQERPA